MCVFKAPSPPPAPEPIPETPPVVAQATTGKVQNAPQTAGTTDGMTASTASRKRLGRGSLRIPLASSGLSGSGLNFPSA